MKNGQFRPDPKPEKRDKKKPVRIKRLSDKRKKQNEEYLVLRKEYLLEHPGCEIRLAGCTGKAIEIHHARKRTGSLLTDKRYFVATCRKCHEKAERDNLKLK